MYVIFTTDTKDGGESHSKAMVCFHSNQDEQCTMMHNQDISEQVKEWLKSNSGNPPKFYSRINIKEFTNRPLKFSNI